MVSLALSLWIWTNALGDVEMTSMRHFAPPEAVEVDSIPDSDTWSIQPDVTVPILDADGHEMGTARLIATPELSLVLVTNSASPQRKQSIQLRDYREAVTQRQTRRAELVAGAAQARTNAASANSVPALRAEVARLAEIIEAMLEEKR